MTLYSKCVHALVKPDVLAKYKKHLGFLPPNLKCAILSILCKRGLIHDLFIFKELLNSNVTIMDLSECEVTDELLICLSECRSIQKLDLSLARKQTRSISSETFIQLFQHLNALRIIKIPHCSEVNDRVVESICENCAKLQQIHIPNSSITDHSLYLIGKCLNILAAIDISGTQITDLGIADLVKNSLALNLVEINIDKCDNITNQSLILFAEKLKNLKIFNCGSLGSGADFDSVMNKIHLRAKQIFFTV